MKCLNKVVRLALLASASAIASVTMLAGPTLAATAPVVACLQTPAKLSDPDIQKFMKDPAALLRDNPAGGMTLTDAVRSLAGSDSGSLQKIMDLAKNANESQKSAIAGGLARVVGICGNLGSAPAQDYAGQIQASIANSGDQYLTSTFQQAAQEVNVASNGPGAAGNSSGGGETTTDAGQQGATSTFKYAAEQPVDTTSGQYTIGTANAVDNVISPTQ